MSTWKIKPALKQWACDNIWNNQITSNNILTKSYSYEVRTTTNNIKYKLFLLKGSKYKPNEVKVCCTVYQEN